MVKISTTFTTWITVPPNVEVLVEFVDMERQELDPDVAKRAGN